jgi:hypothetical protein
MAGTLVLSSAVGVECLVYERRQVARGRLPSPSFSPQRGGGMNGVM